MRKITINGICAFLAVSMISCEGRKVQNAIGKMRVINASHLSGGVNIDMDYKRVYANDIEYLNYSLFAPYIATRHKLHIKDIAGNVIGDTAITIGENKNYAVFVFDSSGSMRYRIFEESFIAPKGSYYKMRFLHLSNSAPMVDLVNGKTGALVHTSYTNADYSEFETYAANDSLLYIVNESSTQTPIYSQSIRSFKPGVFYTMYLKGNPGSLGIDSLGLFVIENNQDY